MVSPNDVTKPVTPDDLQSLETLHDEFARNASGSLTTNWGQVVDVDCALVDQIPYKDFMISLAHPCCAHRFHMRPSDDWGVIDFSTPVIFPFVDRDGDGQDASNQTEEGRFARIQAGVINPVIRQAIRDLESAWEPASRVDITDIELETIPSQIKVAEPDDKVIVLRFEVNATHLSGMISLCYPPSIIKLI